MRAIGHAIDALPLPRIVRALGEPSDCSGFGASFVLRVSFVCFVSGSLGGYEENKVEE
jgi:hypothetical protein